MRMVGTISSALGFVFLGVWMIIDRSNPQLADMMFKWWPLIIITLGIEVLLSFSKQDKEMKKPGFNGLIVFVVIVFICVNMFRGVFPLFSINGNGLRLDKIFHSSMNFDSGNDKKLSVATTLQESGQVKRLRFESNNGLINIHRSQDGKVRIVVAVYVDRDSKQSSYQLPVDKTDYGYLVRIKEDEVKRINADLFIPDGCELDLNLENGYIKGVDRFQSSSFSINTVSGIVELNGGKKLTADLVSGQFRIRDIEEVKIDSGSGMITLDGNVKRVDASLSSGTFNLDNASTEKINLDMSSGIINIKTKEKNLEIDAKLDSGICTINGDKRINSGISKVLGSGGNPINVSINSGTIKISSQE